MINIELDRILVTIIIILNSFNYIGAKKVYPYK